jgi:hypothetical protein
MRYDGFNTKQKRYVFCSIQNQGAWGDISGEVKDYFVKYLKYPGEYKIHGLR